MFIIHTSFFKYPTFIVRCFFFYLVTLLPLCVEVAMCFGAKISSVCDWVTPLSIKTSALRAEGLKGAGIVHHGPEVSVPKRHGDARFLVLFLLKTFFYK